MVLIAHRGNTSGPNSSKENHPDYIEQALDLGYHVEIDVWRLNSKFVLGHDAPQYEIDWNFLSSHHDLWCHAKNLDALSTMLNHHAYQGVVNCFWHESDTFTITSRGHIWTYPGMKVCKDSVIVCRDEKDTAYMLKQNIMGVCSDYVGTIKEER